MNSQFAPTSHMECVTCDHLGKCGTVRQAHELVLRHHTCESWIPATQPTVRARLKVIADLGVAAARGMANPDNETGEEGG